MQQQVRNRQETVNKRFKNWGILKQAYRHTIPKHGEAFCAVAVMTQLTVSSGEQLFEYGYKDLPYGDDVSTLTGDSDVSYDATDVTMGSSGLSYDKNS